MTKHRLCLAKHIYCTVSLVERKHTDKCNVWVKSEERYNVLVLPLLITLKQWLKVTFEPIPGGERGKESEGGERGEREERLDRVR